MAYRIAAHRASPCPNVVDVLHRMSVVDVLEATSFLDAVEAAEAARATAAERSDG